MMQSRITLGELLSHLQERGLVSSQSAELIHQKLKALSSKTKDPVYLRLLSGIGAWFASLFIIIAFGIAQLLDKSTGALICGLIILASSLALSHFRQTTFFTQLTLALAIAGNLMILFGLTDNFHDSRLPLLTLAQLVISIAAYYFLKNDFYRFLAPLGAAILATIWIASDNYHAGFHLLITAETILAGWLLLRKPSNERLIPLTYSAAIMLPVTFLVFNASQMHLWDNPFDGSFLPSSLILSTGLVYVYYHLAGHWIQFKEPCLMLACLATLVLGVFTTPGIIVATGLMVLGFALDDDILTGLAYLFFPVFLFLFYYSLNINLLHKSWMIAGSGVFLLFVRWLLSRLKAAQGNQ